LNQDCSNQRDQLPAIEVPYRRRAKLDDASLIGSRVWNFSTTAGFSNGLVASYEKKDGTVVKQKQDYTWVQDGGGRPYIGTVLTTLVFVAGRHSSPSR